MRSGYLGAPLALAALCLLGPAPAAADEGGVKEAAPPPLTKWERRELRRMLKQAERAKRAPRRQARRYRKLRLPGEQLQRNVTKLTGELRWHETLAAAQAVARKQNKPILWIQALGDLSGVL